LSQCRAPLSPDQCAKNSGHYLPDGAPVLPTVFNLTFDGKTLRRCQLKWRIANEVGVSFQRSMRT
jgi:hypothetical protein